MLIVLITGFILTKQKGEKMIKKTGMKFVIIAIMIISIFGCGSLVQVIPSFGNLGGGTSQGLDIDTIIAGLKEALKIGTQKAVEIVSRNNGFYSNASIRIPLPSELEEVEKTLRKIGLGSTIDNFIVDMNHAAEEAAKGAADIFIDAVMNMSISKAQQILSGPDNAATQYFEEQTRGKLYNIFHPVVKNAMDKIGVTQLFDFIIDKYNSIPFVTKVSFDVNRYISNKALDGLFHMLAEEEKKIRTDVSARVTDLLRKVFK